MKKFAALEFAGFLALCVSALLLSLVDWIKAAVIPPPERRRGAITVAIEKVRTVAYSAKCWWYALFARWHVDSGILA